MATKARVRAEIARAREELKRVNTEEIRRDVREAMAQTPRPNKLAALPGQDVYIGAAAVAEPAHLLGVGFHDGIAEADLAVAGDDGAVALLHAEDRGSVILFHGGDVGGRAKGCN